MEIALAALAGAVAAGALTWLLESARARVARVFKEDQPVADAMKAASEAIRKAIQQQ